MADKEPWKREEEDEDEEVDETVCIPDKQPRCTRD
jgi:hypothetical protein